MKARLCILLSGRGSNFQAIHQAILSGNLNNAIIGLVISNKADAPGLQYAKEQGLPALSIRRKDFPDNQALDQAVLDHLKTHQIDVVVLAGYNRIISPVLLQAYPQRILNIHPSLLPAYGGPGMVGHKVHEAVLSNQEQHSGCTVHIVTDVVDGGPILAQATVPVLPNDTPESLAERVLLQEHQLYPQTIQAFIQRLVAANTEKSSYV